MLLYFLRHASAGLPRKDPVKDLTRGLDEAGIEQARSIGRMLASLRLQMDVIISSPLKRSAQTAALVANELGHEGKLLMDKGLAPQAAWQDFRDLLLRYEESEAILLVGHKPNLSHFLERVIARDAERASVELKKGALARVELTAKRGTLQWLITPRLFRALQETTASSSSPKKLRK